jgi:hypothetical protein
MSLGHVVVMLHNVCHYCTFVDLKRNEDVRNHLRLLNEKRKRPIKLTKVGNPLFAFTIGHTGICVKK